MCIYKLNEDISEKNNGQCFANVIKNLLKYTHT